MRKPVSALACVLLASAASGSASASPNLAKPKPIDLSAARARVEVYRDDVGNYYVAPRMHAPDATDDDQLVFFGDGKTMYRQSVIGSGSDGRGYEWTLWAPRVVGQSHAGLYLNLATPYLECKSGVRRPLTILPADQAKQIVEHATFLPPLWIRSSALLARDEDGVYYFVDHLNDEHGGKDYRVFVGQKGAMKELPMTNVVSDSEGQIFATKRGELRIVSSNADNKATWRKGSVRTPLVRLEPSDNRYLIYRELGIYGQLGTVCEDQ